MGSVLSSVGKQVGGTVGGVTGSFADAAGINDNFTGSNPLSPEAQDALNQALLKSQAGFQQNQMGQQNLAAALLAQSNGQGVNPAQAMLNQNTDRNIQQNTGMIASQKGINPALAQRLAAQNQATMSQQAAGQAATMGAQQQLAAQGQLGSVYNNMANQNIGNTQASGGLTNQGGLGAQGLSAQASAMNAQTRAQMVGGAMSGAGSAAMAAAHGAIVPGHAQVAGDSPQNDTVPALLSPGEVVIPRSVAANPDQAKEFIEHLRKSKTPETGYGKVLEAHRKMQESMDILKECMGGKV